MRLTQGLTEGNATRASRDSGIDVVWGRGRLSLLRKWWTGPWSESRHWWPQVNIPPPFLSELVKLDRCTLLKY